MKLPPPFEPPTEPLMDNTEADAFLDAIYDWDHSEQKSLRSLLVHWRSEIDIEGKRGADLFETMESGGDWEAIHRETAAIASWVAGRTIDANELEAALNALSAQPQVTP